MKITTTFDSLTFNAEGCDYTVKLDSDGEVIIYNSGTCEFSFYSKARVVSEHRDEAPCPLDALIELLKEAKRVVDDRRTP